VGSRRPQSARVLRPAMGAGDACAEAGPSLGGLGPEEAEGLGAAVRLLRADLALFAGGG
jgi:hypothetical protein